MDETPVSRWERFKKAVGEHHSKTLIGVALGQSTTELWSEIRKNEFDEAKRLSDFIGMLVRLGFLYLAFLYLGKLAKEGGMTFSGVMLGMATVPIVALYIRMIFHIWGIVSAYFASDTAHWKTKIGKVPILILSLAQTWIFVYGVTTVAHAIAQSNSIIH